MKTKCYYKGPEFVPCEERRQYNCSSNIWLPYDKIKFCPFCGASLKKPEEEKPWWLVPGIALQHIEESDINTVDEIKNGIVYFYKGLSCKIEVVIFDYKPIGGPFDMIPDFQRPLFIVFRQSGAGLFNDEYGFTVADFPIWHNCPEVFRGKTFSLEGLK